MMTYHGQIVTARYYHDVALGAYKRCQSECTDAQDYFDYDPLVSIVFSAAAAETYINELGEIASDKALFPCGFGSVLNAAEEVNANTTAKYQLVRLALAGAAFNRGSDPFQSFSLLLFARNMLLHKKIDKYEESSEGIRKVGYEEVMRRFPVGIQVKSPGPRYLSSAGMLCTPAAAKWACNSAAGIVNEVTSLALPKISDSQVHVGELLPTFAVI